MMNCLLGETTSTATTNTSSTTPTKTSSTQAKYLPSNSSSNLNINNHNVINNSSSSSSSSSSAATSVNNNTTNRLNTSGYNNLNISQHTQINANQSSNTQETCLICGDVASGKHYGLRSCEACKAFFKRTVQGKIEYSCPATRECEINKRRRKACQACRFQKCLNMGMLKEGVRLDRVRGGRQKYRRGLSPGPGNTSSVSSMGGTSVDILNSGARSVVAGATTTPPNHLHNHHHHNHLAGSNEGNNSTNSCYKSQQLGSSTNGSLSATNLSTSETARILTALINCEPEELTASPAQFISNIPSSLSVQMKTLYILSDLFDRELVSLIGWAKQIPGFTETINLNDQMRLLQSTWAEVIALSIGYRSHLKRVETYRQQHGNFNNNNNCNNYYHFINTTPSPTSSSPASTASSYNQHIYSNNNNNSNMNSSYSSLNSSSSSSACSYNLESIEIKLVFAKDMVIDFKHALACGADEIFYNCVQLVKRLDQVKITSKEFILLKAISLTNADVRLENPTAIHQLRDLLMDALYETTAVDFTSHQTNSLLGQSDITDGSLSLVVNNSQNKYEAQEQSSNSISAYASTSSPKPTSSSLPTSSVAMSSSPSKGSPNCNSNNIFHHVETGSAQNSGRKMIINQRFNQVLLCLPVLRQIDSCIRRFWNDVRKGPNSVPMNKLFEEMLEPCQRIHKSTL